MSKLISFCLLFLFLTTVSAADWPMWRYNSSRTASAPGAISSEKPQLIWKQQFLKREQVWDDPLNNYLMQYDKNFEPIVIGKTVILNFNDSDKVLGLDSDSGKEIWHFYTEGPVRLAPVGWKKNVLFGSDDGYFYSLDAATGKLNWKFRAAPADKKVLGNRRIISMWPVRGGPVVDKDTVYFSAGIWPFMGIFIYALDAESGKVKWLNDSEGSKFQPQPHNPSMAFAGVAPQGAFALSQNYLIVPGGRSVPAILDKKTGKLINYNFAKYSKYVGGDFVASVDNYCYVRSRNNKLELGVSILELKSGENVMNKTIKGYPVITDKYTFFTGKKLNCYKNDDSGKTNDKSKLWSMDVDASNDLIMVGDTLISACDGKITAVKLQNDGQGTKLWELPVKDNILRLIAADDKIFAISEDGKISAYGKAGSKPSIQKYLSVKIPSVEKSSFDTGKILAKNRSKAGWALVLQENENVVYSLLNSTSMNIVLCSIASPDKIKKMRNKYDKLGLYGKRVSVIAGMPEANELPKYVFELIIDNRQGSKYNKSAYLLQSLRPYTGRGLIRKSVKTQKSEGFVISGTYNNWEIVDRVGPLKGAASWTHNYGSIAQTSKSDDKLVKLPLGPLWWGGSSNKDVLPRHAHGPGEQVIGGRLVIEGMECLAARDVYTGRILWKREFKDLNEKGIYWDKSYNPNPLFVGYNQKHIYGANIRGTNYIATEDIIYLLNGNICLFLDAATGKTIKELKSPSGSDWAYIGVYNNLLICGDGFANFPMPSKNSLIYDHSASKKIVVMERKSGKKLWDINAANGFLHNGICAGNGILFLMDRKPVSVVKRAARLGKASSSNYNLKGIDILSGKVLWNYNKDVFGTFLAYSEQNDILIQSLRPSRDISKGESGNRICAIKGTTGKTLWDKNIKYKTFPILHNNHIINESGKWDIFTGDRVARIHPITGKKEEWNWTRTYGCNYPIASEYMLTFRSGAASFYDLVGDSGTGSFGGFKSGCTNNLIAADGVLNAPDYTRTCNCAYQIQTSIALVHMPEAEFWTSSTIGKVDRAVDKVGLNIGAPGDRRAENGTLWLDFPSVGGSSPDPEITINKNCNFRLDNSYRYSGRNRWIYASCAEGINSISIKLNKGVSSLNDEDGKYETIIPKHARWKYLLGSKPNSNWKSTSFNDSKWKTGEAGFGYGDGDDQTTLNDLRKHGKMLIRHEFEIKDPSKWINLKLLIGYDDYFTAYINGKKVAQTKGSHERKKGVWESFEITEADKLLIKGKNTVAIEGNNIKLSSSDFSLDPYLVGKAVEENSSKENETTTAVKGAYTIRLYFAEPDDLKKGDRIFGVTIGNKSLLKKFDIVAEAGAPRKGIIKEFKNINSKGSINIKFKSASSKYAPVISGIEIIKQQ